MKPNKPFCYSVFASQADPMEAGTVVTEELFSAIHDAEAFASLQPFATVIDNFSDAVVGVWQSGREI